MQQVQRIDPGGAVQVLVRAGERGRQGSMVKIPVMRRKA